MAIITNLSELKVEIVRWLDESDLPLDDMIRFAEAQMRRDFRARRLETDAAFSVGSLTETLPDDFYAMYGFYHTTDNYGTIEIIGPNEFGDLRRQFTGVDVPQWAVLEGTEIRFVPTPDQTYNTVMQYWAQVPYLTTTDPTNWMIEENPDVYLYGALMQSAAFVREDVRYQMWLARYEAALNELSAATKNRHFGGKLRRKAPAIGG